MVNTNSKRGHSSAPDAEEKTVVLKKSKVEAAVSTSIIELMKKRGMPMRAVTIVETKAEEPDAQAGGLKSSPKATPVTPGKVQKQADPCGSGMSREMVKAYLANDAKHSKMYADFCTWHDMKTTDLPCDVKEDDARLDAHIDAIVKVVYETHTGGNNAKNDAVIQLLVEDETYKAYFLTNDGLFSRRGQEAVNSAFEPAISRFNKAVKKKWWDMVNDELLPRIWAHFKTARANLFTPEGVSGLTWVENLMVTEVPEDDRALPSGANCTEYAVMKEFVHLNQKICGLIKTKQGGGPGNARALRWYFAKMAEIIQTTGMVHWCFPQNEKEMDEWKEEYAAVVALEAKWRQWPVTNFHEASHDAITGIPFRPAAE